MKHTVMRTAVALLAMPLVFLVAITLALSSGAMTRMDAQ